MREVWEQGKIDDLTAWFAWWCIFVEDAIWSNTVINLSRILSAAVINTLMLYVYNRVPLRGATGSPGSPMAIT